MPTALIGPAIGLAGSLLGGIGGSGGKSTNQTSNTTSNVNQNTTGSQSGESWQKAFESPYFSQFRESLAPMFQAEYAKTQKPIFGQAQQASFMGNLNDIANSASESLKQSLARSGALNSGRFAGGLEGIERQRMNQQANYFANLPMQEEMARRQSAQGLLGLGMNWAGKAPTDIQNLSNMFSNQSMTGQENKSMTGNMQESGPSWWQGALGNVGGMLGNVGAKRTNAYGQQQGWWGSEP